MSRIPTDLPADLAEDRVLTVPQGALAAGVSPDTLRRAAARGELKLLRLSARRIGIRTSDFRRWLDACST